MKRKYISIASFLAASALSLLFLSCAAADATTTQQATSTDLQAQVDEKTHQLNAVLQQLAATQTSLKGIQQQKTTLQQQLAVIQGNLNVLNLGTQADQLTAQQLTLQTQQFEEEIPMMTAAINNKKMAIQALLQEIQKSDSTGGDLLSMFLKNKDLADTAVQAQSILNIQSQLAIDIENLNGLQNQYQKDIQTNKERQTSIAQHEIDLQAKAAIAQDEKAQQQQLLADTNNQESVFEEQLSQLQEEQEQIDAEIESLDAALRAKINPNALPLATPGILLVPIADDSKDDITQGYGATSYAKNGYKGSWHNGVDLAAPIGTPVLAATDGVIAAVGNNDKYCPRQEYGKYVVVNFNNNLTGLYAHLSRQIVTVGKVVKRGDVIGYSGQTGYATGPHLHFTIFDQATFYMGQTKKCGPMPLGGDVNPMPYLFL
jgi:murein DD-endopeptidase MepM/ murein hydrolase activator NlpD